MLPLLEFEHVTARHHGWVLFADLSLRLEVGQHWAVVGPSGAGKSALLAVLAGQVLLTGGPARYPALSAAAQARFGAGLLTSWRQVVALVGSRPPFRARAGGGPLYYQQRYEATAAQQVPTGREYLTAGAAPPPGTPWTPPRVAERLRLTSLLDQPLIQLSNGESKRLRLATALLRNPLLLLLDNPLAGLDAASPLDFEALLVEIAAAGTAVVLATTPTEVPSIVTHVAELAAGQPVRLQARASFQPAALPPPPRPEAAALRALWPATDPPGRWYASKT